MSNYVIVNGELYHHGVKGMKWGRRRYQNADGSLTPAGRQRYSSDVKSAKAAYKQAGKEYNKAYNNAYNKSLAGFSPIKKHRQANDQRWEEAYDKAQALNKAKEDLKGAKAARKIERKYDKVGRKLGSADYYREKGASVAEKHNRTAEVFDKQANKSEARGEYFKAEASRRAADAIRTRGANEKARQEEMASYYEQRASRITEKVSTYATKKRVDVGKERIDKILKESRKKGYDSAKAIDEANREWELQEKLGDSGYEAYNKIRGRS